jgi:antitoxin component of MazEF toxin-antitoxin module
MRLQKHFSRKVGNKQYSKWVIVIPPKHVKELEWEEGEYLQSDVNNQRLIIQREDIQKVQKRREAAKKAWETRKKRR